MIKGKLPAIIKGKFYPKIIKEKRRAEKEQKSCPFRFLLFFRF